MFSVERVAVFKVSSEGRKTVETLVLSTSRAAERKLRRDPGSTRLTVLHKQRCVACAHFLLHDTDNLDERAPVGLCIVSFDQTVDPSGYLLLDISVRTTRVATLSD